MARDPPAVTLDERWPPGTLDGSSIRWDSLGIGRSWNDAPFHQRGPNRATVAAPSEAECIGALQRLPHKVWPRSSRW